MNLLDKHILRFLEALQKHKVDYLLVGGYAVNFHGHRRPAADLDIWLKDTVENRQNLRQAMKASDMGDYPMIETMQFVPGWTDFQLNNAMRLDIITSVKGLESKTFDQCFDTSITIDVAGIKVPCLSLSDLIENKKVTGRPKDLADIDALDQIRTQSQRPPFLSR